MLDTTSTTIQDAIDDLDGTIEERASDMADLDASTPHFAAHVRSAGDYQQMIYGLEWARDEWGEEAEVVVGAPTAGEEALMHEEAADDASQERMRLWFAAAATEAAPWEEATLTQTFQELATVHGGLIDWIEWQANTLARPEGSEGNRLRTYYAEMQNDTDSQNETTSSTSSSSDSGTA